MILQKGERGLLSLSFLRDFAVTISLEKHGELTAHSKCADYLLTAACGKNIAHEEKKHLKPNSLAAVTVLQEKENQGKELSKTSLHLSRDTQTESTMFYTSKKTKEELERYQDCSWFQSNPNKEEFTSKLSQVEELISPGIEVNELDLAMQFANGEIAPPWGDEYLEVFDDDLQFDLDEKMGGKENHNQVNQPNDNNFNYKLGDENVTSDLYNYDNYSIKKSDSYDNMKNISTNLSQIIPISYHEQLNNKSYNVQPVVKHEIKQELEVGSPDSDNYLVESDDSDLNIGREEVVEDEDEIVEVKPVKSDVPLKSNETTINKIEVIETKPVEKLDKPVKNKDIPFREEDKGSLAEKKSKLKLELNKNSFDGLSINVPTPELDFMDLVNYINNEKLTDSTNTSPSLYLEQSNIGTPLKESSPNTVPVKNNQCNQTTSPKLVKSPTSKTAPKDKRSDLSTVNSEDFSSTLSIAERIKIGSTRKRSNKYSTEKVRCFDEENDDDDWEMEDDEDEYEDVPRRKKRRSKSSSSDNSKTMENEPDSYRERRDKNNAASRKSRQNKKDRERLMFRSLEESERKNLLLKTKADKLEKLVTYLRQMLLQVVLKKGSGT